MNANVQNKHVADRRDKPPRYESKRQIFLEGTSKNAIIFTHHPLFPENGLEALNNREILSVIEHYPTKAWSRPAATPTAFWSFTETK